MPALGQPPTFLATHNNLSLPPVPTKHLVSASFEPGAGTSFLAAPIAPGLAYIYSPTMGPYSPRYHAEQLNSSDVLVPTIPTLEDPLGFVGFFIENISDTSEAA